jgi:3-oxoacyl-[acyl-carrier-protein] synthase-3
MVTLTNIGGTALHIASIAIPAGFHQTNDCATLLPDAMCRIYVTFVPVLAGALGGSLVIQDDGAGSPRAVGLTGMGVQAVASGSQKKVLVIGADVMSSIIDYSDRATCVIFGDGAGAVLIEPAGDDGLGVLDYIHEVDGSGGGSLYMPGGGSLHPSTHETIEKKMHFVHQDGQAVFKYAVRKMADICERLLKRNGVTGHDIDCFVPHQANLRIIRATGDRLGLKPESVIVNIQEFGNTTAGTIPLAMQTARDSGRLKKGDLVLLAAVGAGFTAGACLLRWAY